MLQRWFTSVELCCMRGWMTLQVSVCLLQQGNTAEVVGSSAVITVIYLSNVDMICCLSIEWMVPMGQLVG
jgi:hypothetical protein